MGNCLTRNSRPPPPTQSFESHKTTKHHLRLGVQAGKDEKGELILGVKGGIDNFCDKVVVVGENVIPAIKDLVEHDNSPGENPVQ